MVDEGSGYPQQSGSPSRAAELAAQQVESIVAASQAAADELSRQAAEEAEQIRAAAHQEAQSELAEARRQATALTQESRQSADGMVEEARHEAEQTREQARRSAEARVAGAEQAAEQVLSEAKVLSTGLRRLGENLSDQGERILRDVTAAHRRMQGDLRVGPPDEARPRRAESRPRERPGRSPEPRPTRRASSDPREEELLATVKEAEQGRAGEPPRRRASRENPIDDLDVPNWVDD